MIGKIEKMIQYCRKNSNFIITKAAIVDEKIEFTINIVKENDHEN